MPVIYPYIGRREDADSNRMVALGVSGGGGAVVALSARNIPGLKAVINVSGGLSLLNCDNNSDRLIEMVMLDVDGFPRQHSLPTWDYGEARALVEKHGIKRWAYPIELYAAAPGYKALAKSTTGDFVANVYAADTLELAKERAIAVCQERHVGHTCKVIDPPESRADK